MIFDDACALIERYIPPLKDRMESARVFLFPELPHEALPKEYDPEVIGFLKEHFTLPFNTVAVEDPCTCVLLWDLEKDASGVKAKRGFLNIAPLKLANIMASASAKGLDPEHIRRQLAKYPPNSYWVAEGIINYIDMDHEKWMTDATVKYVALVTKDGGVLDAETRTRTNGEEFDLLSEDHIRSARTAMEELFVFNTPNRFIVEESSEAIQKYQKTPRKDRKKITRSDMRPRYTLLKPGEIRKKLGLDAHAQGTHASPRVHERRRHPRTYPDDPQRWPNKHGQTIIVPAMWVGKSDGWVGRKYYRICLEL